MAARHPQQGILDLPPSAGTFNRLELAHDRLATSGWAFHPQHALDAIDVYVDGEPAGPARTARRPGAEKMHAWAGVRPLGFAFDLTHDRDSIPSRLDLVCRQGGAPVSRMSCLLPLEREGRTPLPPDHLADRVAGRHGPIFRFQGLRMYTDISDQMARFGILPSARILDWGCGCGRVTSHILARQPKARVVGCDIDCEAIKWCRENLPGEFERIEPMPPTRFAAAEIDVVIACSVLTHLTRKNQDKWFKEIRRILAPGGYFLASTAGDYAYRRTRSQGTLPLWKRLLPRKRADTLSGIDDSLLDSRLDGIAPPGYYRAVAQSRDYTVAACSKYFEFVDYLEHGLDGFQDLVILRRGD